jgi:hypothetical protein
MFDLNQITPVLDHLKQVSPNMFRKISQKEIMIHCPFCDDSLRKNASSHGHLYISTEYPVYNCFRCNSSGTLITFLIETGFDDRDVLEYLASFIKISYAKDYTKLRKKGALAPQYNQLKKEILNYNISFKKKFNNHYIKYINYINKRIGENINTNFFLISPFIYDNNTTCRFTNYIGENVLLRYIDVKQNNQRYVINKNTSNLYYFQDITEVKNIVLCEGPFDIISLYLYNDLFKNNTFISINGKNYINVIERLILMYHLISEIEINLIFDTEYLNKCKKVIKGVKNITKIYNGKISINNYKPLVGNDVAEFPGLIRIEE